MSDLKPVTMEPVAYETALLTTSTWFKHDPTWVHKPGGILHPSLNSATSGGSIEKQEMGTFFIGGGMLSTHDHNYAT